MVSVVCPPATNLALRVKSILTSKIIWYCISWNACSGVTLLIRSFPNNFYHIYCLTQSILPEVCPGLFVNRESLLDGLWCLYPKLMDCLPLAFTFATMRLRFRSTMCTHQLKADSFAILFATAHSAIWIGQWFLRSSKDTRHSDDPYFQQTRRDQPRRSHLEKECHFGTSHIRPQFFCQIVWSVVGGLTQQLILVSFGVYMCLHACGHNVCKIVIGWTVGKLNNELTGIKHRVRMCTPDWLIGCSFCTFDNSTFPLVAHFNSVLKCLSRTSLTISSASIASWVSM